MKSLTINTLVMAVAMTLWATASMAGEVSNLPMSSSEKDIAAAASPAPFHALSHLDAQTLAAQEMTDRELKAIEGGAIYSIDLSFLGTVEIPIGLPYLKYTMESVIVN